MSQPRFPDPARSRAVLIGASRFTAAGPELPEIPAVEANLTALRQVLTSPDTGVLLSEHCRSLADPVNADEVGDALSTAAATATDLLLVYYAGHGLVDERGRLHLALVHTYPDRIRWTALPLELLREEIANSAAATRVLVLDCCFSGRAIETMTDSQSVISGQLDVAGTYTLTSTTANAPSHAPFGERYTAFTSALLRALDEADPLTLDQIYAAVDSDLAARNLPRPQRRAVNAAGDLALSRGPAAGPHTEPADSDEVRFAGEHPARRVLLQIFKWFSRVVLWVILLVVLPVVGLLASIYVLTIVLPALSIAVLETTVGTLPAGLKLVISILLPVFILLEIWYFSFTLPVSRRIHSVFRRLATFIPSGLVSGGNEVQVRELTIDRSGLTVQGTRAKTRLPWRDIVQVGVLQPERGSSDQHQPAARHEREHVLVVRLRADVPAPGIVSVLSDEHRQLGYLGLCTLEDIRSSPPEMISTLEQFAGSKLHSPRQFLDRDLRLRPDMV